MVLGQRGWWVFDRLRRFPYCLARKCLIAFVRENGKVHHINRGIFLDRVIYIFTCSCDDLLLFVVARCATIRGQWRELLTFFLNDTGPVLATHEVPVKRRFVACLRVFLAVG